MKYTYVHKDDLRRWQLATLAVQQDLQNTLDKYDINMWCGGGTLIGAIRDGGFIYWDNDLDTFFMFEDYKKIMFALWESRLAHKYDIYYHRGFWEPHVQLNQLLKADTFDSERVDMELVEVSKHMIKIFSNEPVRVKLFNSDKGRNGEYVKINHYSKHHLTRHRVCYQSDDIEDGKTYGALPDVCMLPMMNMTRFEYFRSSLLFILIRLIVLIRKIMGRYERQLDNKNSYAINIEANKKAKTEFENVQIASTKNKIMLIIKNLVGSLKLCASFKNNGKEYIAYKPMFFRFEVLPYLKKDIFPLQKIEFEGVLINVPQNPEKLLETQFENFREVPNEASRIALPFFLKSRMN